MLIWPINISKYSSIYTQCKVAEKRITLFRCFHKYQKQGQFFHFKNTPICNSKGSLLLLTCALQERLQKVIAKLKSNIQEPVSFPTLYPHKKPLTYYTIGYSRHHSECQIDRASTIFYNIYYHSNQ